MIRGIVTILLLLAICLRTSPTKSASLSNPINFVSSNFKRSFHQLLRTPNKANCLTITACLLLSGDIEMNPGPQSIYPCALCDLAVNWSCKAICCDSCQVWIHKTCVDMNSEQYSLIGRSNVSWLCPRCDNSNCDTFTFNSFEISCYNSFAPLADDQTRSVNSISSDIFSPKHTSSPKANTSCKSPHSLPSNTSHRISQPRQLSENSSVFELPKKTNLRVMNVNCQSVKNKRAELHTVLSYIKPDLVCGTESWLQGIQPGKPPEPGPNSISSSEIFPEDYNVYRKDRNVNGGGIFILAHKSLTVEEKTTFNTNCEIDWIKIKLHNTKDLYFGAFYMPHRNDHDLAELQRSIEMISETTKGDAHIILSGDFNCPDINWEDHTVNQNAQDRPIQQKLADLTSSASLTQIHNQPTRLSAILDLTFTTNPSLLKNSTSLPGISDHNIVVSDFDTKPSITRERPRKTYKFKNAKWEQINNDLKTFFLTAKIGYNDNKSAEELWTSFKTFLKSTMDKNIPSSSSRKRTRLPWINQSIKRLLKKKVKLYRQAKQTLDWTNYKKQTKIMQARDQKSRMEIH